MRGSAAHGFPAGRDRLQAEVALDVAHERFLATPVVAVARHAAVVADAVGEQVDVLVLGVGMARQDVLVVVEAHAFQIPLADGAPLVVGELFAGSGGERDVQDGLGQARA